LIIPEDADDEDEDTLNNKLDRAVAVIIYLEAVMIYLFSILD